jgi:hypothetical protein
VSIKKTVAGTLEDRAEAGQDSGPPTQQPQDDGDIATPKTQPPTEDDKPLE